MNSSATAPVPRSTPARPSAGSATSGPPRSTRPRPPSSAGPTSWPCRRCRTMCRGWPASSTPRPVRRSRTPMSSPRAGASPMRSSAIWTASSRRTAWTAPGSATGCRTTRSPSPRWPMSPRWRPRPGTSSGSGWSRRCWRTYPRCTCTGCAAPTRAGTAPRRPASGSSITSSTAAPPTSPPSTGSRGRPAPTSTATSRPAWAPLARPPRNCRRWRPTSWPAPSPRPTGSPSPSPSSTAS